MDNPVLILIKTWNIHLNNVDIHRCIWKIKQILIGQSVNKQKNIWCDDNCQLVSRDFLELTILDAKI
jgi:hypothetical protein